MNANSKYLISIVSDPIPIPLDTLRQFAHDGGAVLLVTHDQRTADLADNEIRL